MKLKEGLIIQKIDDEYVLIDSGIVSPAFNGMIKLNETSKVICDLLLEKDLSVDEITDELLKIYDASKEEVLSGVKSFVKELSKTSVLIK